MKKNEAVPTSGGGVTASSSLATPISSASKNSIAEGKTDVKRQYSLSEGTQAGTDYLDAVSRCDMDVAQKMVDEAAKAAGYTIKAYHGTSSEFTTFQHRNMLPLYRRIR